ncbi:transposase [Ancylobacter sp. VNQ12]|uniref:transposase n=1 Tax=Ancylobacter sp. VNQ12 TaxID=3400920 RepID=UPI003C0CD0C4
MLVAQLRLVNEQILNTDRLIQTNARSTEVSRRLMEIPGVGPLLASALIETIADPKAFRTGQNLAAWIGLVPKQNSSGGKERLGGITKQGDRYLQQMLVVGALAVVRYARAQRHAPAVADPAARAPNAEGRGSRAGQQNRPDGLGDHDIGRALPGASRGIEIRSRRSATVDKLGKGGQDVMRQPVDTGRQENPLAPERLERVLLVGTVFAEGIMASGHAYRTSRSNTWSHRPGSAEPPITLARGEPSTHGA